MKAVCLLSGGLDSSTCLAVARREGYECYALSFDYGQRHRVELESAARIAKLFDVKEHRVVKIDLRAFGGSALTDDIDVPKSGVDGERNPDHLRAGAQHDFSVVCDGVGRGAGMLRRVHRRQCDRLFGISGLPARVHRRVRADGEPGDQGCAWKAACGCGFTRRWHR